MTDVESSFREGTTAARAEVALLRRIKAWDRTSPVKRVFMRLMGRRSGRDELRFLHMHAPPRAYREPLHPPAPA